MQFHGILRHSPVVSGTCQGSVSCFELQNHGSLKRLVRLSQSVVFLSLLFRGSQLTQISSLSVAVSTLCCLWTSLAFSDQRVWVLLSLTTSLDEKPSMQTICIGSATLFAALTPYILLKKTDTREAFLQLCLNAEFFPETFSMPRFWFSVWLNLIPFGVCPSRLLGFIMFIYARCVLVAWCRVPVACKRYSNGMTPNKASTQNAK